MLCETVMGTSLRIIPGGHVVAIGSECHGGDQPNRQGRKDELGVQDEGMASGRGSRMMASGEVGIPSQITRRGL